MKKNRFLVFIGIGCVILLLLGQIGCRENEMKSEPVIIYSNADEEAVKAITKTLDSHGLKGKYLFQTFGTSELGSKLLVEGNKIEADIVTMSTFYLDSAQKKNKMFQSLQFEVNTLQQFPSYCAPITAQEGTIIVNTVELRKSGLRKPNAIRDLANEEYRNKISVTDIQSSSTAWLMIQALIAEYGEDRTKEILKEIYKNAGDHIEQSGSAPLKKVRTGEVVIGFGLRQQAMKDKKEGLPIDFVDPKEGNFMLTESLAVVEKGKNTKTLSMEIAKCIIQNARKEIQVDYPVALYKNESEQMDRENQIKIFPQSLTVELLENHKQLSEMCKE